MLLNLAPANEAVLSNVGEIGEFRIRNSAKAFNILSSGLYANKIRAIVRELSCNAVDSHVAAGRADTPFDVHLPSQLEPWFAIRDYGTGLSHDQVTNIYTTYFESTKTDSNDYIGALGLGSKSPFSYTDNFTVTAIKDGKKGIYSAFINGDGVPSIAKMGEEDTIEPAGVEVKFSVNDRWDFSKFIDEASTVYTYFKLRPVISGSNNFQFHDVEYDTKDIIPGVHSQRGGRSRSIAIMGNIAYPIDVPQANQKDFGDLAGLLGCGLEMHFAIGELDFQASREGLSYIPQTIASIKAKLEVLNSALAGVLAKEADAISNEWERAFFLLKKKENNLWSSAVKKYIVDTKFDLIDVSGNSSYYIKAVDFVFSVDELAKTYNIDIAAFQKSIGGKSTSSLNSHTVYSKTPGDKDYRAWDVVLREGVTFVKNDTKIGASARAKFHWNNTKFEKDAHHYQTVYVLNKADKNKPAKFDEFLKAVRNPPASLFASELMQKERAANSLGGKNVTIMQLGERGYGGYYREKEMVWKDAGKADSFDDNQTYYYLPLKGFEVQSEHGSFDVKQFYSDMKECGVGAAKVDIYGVRKGDIDFIKTQKNWVNIELHLSKVLKVVDHKLMMSLALQAIDSYNLINYNDSIVKAVTNPKSPYLNLVMQFKGFDKVKYSEASLRRLCGRYAKDVKFSPEAFVQKFVNEASAVSERYPLLQYLRSAPNKEVAEYVNLVDTQKGV
jgi:hypothetical protein